MYQTTWTVTHWTATVEPNKCSKVFWFSITYDETFTRYLFINSSSKSFPVTVSSCSLLDNKYQIGKKIQSEQVRKRGEERTVYDLHKKKSDEFLTGNIMDEKEAVVRLFDFTRVYLIIFRIFNMNENYIFDSFHLLFWLAIWCMAEVFNVLQLITHPFSMITKRFPAFRVKTYLPRIHWHLHGDMQATEARPAENVLFSNRLTTNGRNLD